LALRPPHRAHRRERPCLDSGVRRGTLADDRRDRSRSERQMRRLTQKIGILEQELAQAKRSAEAGSEPARVKTGQVIPLPKSSDV